MSGRFFVVTCFVLAAGTAFGAGSLISYFRSPCGEPVGMCYHGGYIYHMDNRTGRIYQTTTTGSVVRSLAGPSGGIGVHFTGTHFWVSTYSPGMVYYLNSSGSVVNSFSGPAPGYGITTNGTYLWYSSGASGNRVWQLTTTGSIVASFKGPGIWSGGLDWDSRGYLWLADWPAPRGSIYRLTTTGSVAESYSPVPVVARSSGCAWDGSCVWFCDYTYPNLVYQMDTTVTSVMPESLGKIKSIHR